MRAFWNRVPMLRVAFALIKGIGLALMLNQDKFYLSLVWTFLGLLILCFIAAITFNGLKNPSLAYKYQVWNGVATTVGIISCGYLLSTFHIQNHYASDFSNFLGGNNQLVVQLDQPPVIRSKI